MRSYISSFKQAPRDSSNAGSRTDTLTVESNSRLTFHFRFSTKTRYVFCCLIQGPTFEYSQSRDVVHGPMVRGRDAAEKCG